MFRIVSGRHEATPLQRSYFRAGHAHAGVLLLLALVCQLLADATTQTGVLDWLSRSGVAVAAILMPAGFFLSSMGRGVTQPNRLVGLVLAGAALLAASLGSLGVGAGVTIGTVADNGFAFAGRFLLALVFPGPVLMIEGKANLLAERSSLGDDPAFRALVARR